MHHVPIISSPKEENSDPFFHLISQGYRELTLSTKSLPTHASHVFVEKKQTLSLKIQPNLSSYLPKDVLNLNLDQEILSKSWPFRNLDSDEITQVAFTSREVLIGCLDSNYKTLAKLYTQLMLDLPFQGGNFLLFDAYTKGDLRMTEVMPEKLQFYCVACFAVIPIISIHAVLISPVIVNLHGKGIVLVLHAGIQEALADQNIFLMDRTNNTPTLQLGQSLFSGLRMLDFRRDLGIPELARETFHYILNDEKKNLLHLPLKKELLGTPLAWTRHAIDHPLGKDALESSLAQGRNILCTDPGAIPLFDFSVKLSEKYLLQTFLFLLVGDNGTLQPLIDHVFSESTSISLPLDTKNDLMSEKRKLDTATQWVMTEYAQRVSEIDRLEQELSKEVPRSDILNLRDRLGLSISPLKSD